MRAQALDSAVARFSSAITTAQAVGGVAADNSAGAEPAV
jgi:hypothetical protein